MAEKRGRSAKIVNMFKPAVATSASGRTLSKIGREEFCHRVASKAYELYVKRGCGHGNDQSDWYEAERLVRIELGL